MLHLAHPSIDICMNMIKPLERERLPERRPYSGEFGGMTWNARAFFSRQGIKMTKRFAKVRSMAAKVGFLALQETHSSPERAAAVQCEFPSHALFWSHCSLQRGGLALGVSKEFICRFSAASWKEIEKGRAAKLELRGPQGSLDLCSLYLDDQSAAARRNSLRLLGQSAAQRRKYCQ